MLHIASSLVLIVIVTGLYFRRRRPALHVSLMTTAFLIDFLLVIYIEISRHAVEKVVRHVSPMVYFHAAISLCVLIAYAIMIWLGRRLLSGKQSSRSVHRNMGIAFVVLRGLNYITALIM